VVDALLADDAEEAALLRGRVRLDDVPGGEVAAADVEDLALAEQLLHRLPDLLPRRAAIDVVHLVEVDPIRAEAPQTVLARLADVPRGEPAIVRAVAHRAVDLGREHDLLATPAALREPLADDRLRRALAGVAAV